MNIKTTQETHRFAPLRKTSEPLCLCIFVPNIIINPEHENHVGGTLLCASTELLRVKRKNVESQFKKDWNLAPQNITTFVKNC